MDIKNFTSAIQQLAEEKGMPKEKVFEVVEQAYAAAYKKDYGKKGQIIKARLSQKSGQVKFWQVKQVLDQSMILSEEELEKMKKEASQKAKDLPAEAASGAEAGAKATAGEEKVRFNPEKHIMLEDAKKIDPDIKVGDDLEIPLKSEADYGRIAAQTAKQVVLQRLKEAERDLVFEEYSQKEGELLSGVVQRIEGRSVYFDIGRTLGILPPEEQVPREFYKPGQRFKLYITKVEQTSRGPLVFLSRAYPKIVSKLFEIEAPEISQGQVVIKAIAREPGSRSKVAVASTDEKVDPIGSVVGQRGTRVGAVINELGGEKIDIIEYSEKPEEFIANALSPAKVLEVRVGLKNKALCLVPDDQLSLAIGKEGQNVRLAAKLTGWKIDVRGLGGEKQPEAKKPDKRRKEKVGARSKTTALGKTREKSDRKAVTLSEAKGPVALQRDSSLRSE